MKIRAILAIAAFGLVGCKSTPEVIEPRPLDTNASYAYNIANQTSLIRNESPLRDFTTEEVNKVKTELTRPSGAEASVVLGSLTILTGNLTGIINVAGGGATYLANKNHAASKARWIIALPKKDYASVESAVEYARDKVMKSQMSAYSQYGKVEAQLNKKSQARYLTVTSNGKTTPIGGVFDVDDAPLVTEGDFKGEPSYLIGFANEVYPSFMTPTDPLLVAVELLNGQDIIESTYEGLTAGTGEGFYLYVPSFRKTNAHGKSYTSTNMIVPAIYTQGEKHEFLKPE